MLNGIDLGDHQPRSTHIESCQTGTIRVERLVVKVRKLFGDSIYIRHCLSRLSLQVAKIVRWTKRKKRWQAQGKGVGQIMALLGNYYLAVARGR